MFSFFLLILFLRVFCVSIPQLEIHIYPVKMFLCLLNLVLLQEGEGLKVWEKSLRFGGTARKCGINVVWGGIRGHEEFQRKQVKKFIYSVNKYLLSCLSSDTVLYPEALVVKTVLPSWSLCYDWVRKGVFSLPTPWDMWPHWDTSMGCVQPAWTYLAVANSGVFSIC